VFRFVRPRMRTVPRADDCGSSSITPTTGNVQRPSHRAAIDRRARFGAPRGVAKAQGTRSPQGEARHRPWRQEQHGDRDSEHEWIITAQQRRFPRLLHPHHAPANGNSGALQHVAPAAKASSAMDSPGMGCCGRDHRASVCCPGRAAFAASGARAMQPMIDAAVGYSPDGRCRGHRAHHPGGRLSIAESADCSFQHTRCIEQCAPNFYE